ncbi:hypothetical protein N7452_008634 [Penicillium brevicompactum]|uniref:Uncharacterized protein n=1 Tax=Penicillium brevicompactum TaxID=5074 RepID=A0A9W9Q6V4_PENBR|nr:hypothetical protein N7452_008634 [Penicillium brevicompactum]
MGKKRRGPSLEEILERPWCYYCERDFDDLKILISHQKAKHFKCERCGRRLNTAGGLSVHLSQVHKEQLTEVDNALPNRMGLEVEIFGMEGIPDEVLKSHQQRVATQFQQEELQRQADTGNPPAGSAASGQPAKKPKIEATSDLKKRLAEHKAKRAAQALGGASSGDVTPHRRYSDPHGPNLSPQLSRLRLTLTLSPMAAVPLQPLLLSRRLPVLVIRPTLLSVEHSCPALHPTPRPHTPRLIPPGCLRSPQSRMELLLHLLSNPHPPEHKGMGLPAASNLPQRPAFAAPSVNAHQMQQMHLGQQMSSPATPVYSNGQNTPAPVQTPIDDQVSGAQATAQTEASDKPAKKEKAKPAVRMIYNHDTLSPEEKMAQLPRYVWTPDHSTETVLGDVPGSTIVGAIQDSDTVVDPAK